MSGQSRLLLLCLQFSQLFPSLTTWPGCVRRIGSQTKRDFHTLRPPPVRTRDDHIMLSHEHAINTNFRETILPCLWEWP